MPLLDLTTIAIITLKLCHHVYMGSCPLLIGLHSLTSRNNSLLGLENQNWLLLASRQILRVAILNVSAAVSGRVCLDLKRRYN
jgi:hypothetical protein